MASLSLRLLGHLQIESGGALISLTARKGLALLIWLALNRHAQDRERLAAMFWPDVDDTRARANLRRVLWTLNQSPLGQVVDASADTINLQMAELDVDVLRFEALLSPTRPAITQLSQAVELYRGDFLTDFALHDSPEWDDWARDRREHYRRQALAALGTITQDQLDNSQFAAAIDSARRRIAIDDWEETAYQQLFLALAHSGQRATALMEYEALRRRLAAELAVPPSPVTESLIDRIRQGDFDGSFSDLYAQSVASVQVRSTPTQPVGPRAIPPNPYRGLFAFREEDARFFFGREDFTDQLVELAYHRSLVAVIGPSGSGKSSVVHAGLVGSLRRELDWLIGSFRPGRRPFQALAGSLIDLLEPKLPETPRLLQLRQLADALEQGQLSLLEVVDRILQKAQADDTRRGRARLLLVVDQFEELYTLLSDEPERRHFLDTLLALVFDQQHRPAPIFTLAFTLRADFLGQVLTYRPMADALLDTDLKLGPMTRPEMTRAIVNPAHLQQVAFEPGLVARILDDVGDEPGALPLLEFALTALWERQAAGQLTHKAYEAIGRVSGALTRHADDSFAALSLQAQLVARRIFIQLVRPGEGTEDTRRLAARAEFDESTWVLVGQLADSRLLITGRDVAGAETVEVVHEALIRSWVRLREWMTDDRTFRVWQERLRAVLHQWEGTDRDEGALLRGVSLAAAEGWFAERPEDLSPAEVNYIRASVALRERRTAEREQAEAAHQQRERTLRDSRARRLAAQALISNDEPAERAAGLPLLLAREAILTTLTGDGYSLPEATDALRKAILTAPASPLRRLTGHHAPVKTVVFSPDGTSILTAAADGTAGVWDSQTGQVRLMLTGHRDALSTALFSPDGRLIVTAGDDPVAKVWDAQTGQLRHELVGHRNWLQAAAFSPDSSLIATGSIDGTARLWEAATGRLCHTLVGHTDWINAVAFSPDGCCIATASGDMTARLWNTVDGKVVHILTGHASVVWTAAFSPDGAWLVTGSWDKTAWLWAVESGRLQHVLAGHTSLLRQVSFSPDNRYVVTASEDTMAQLWAVQTGCRQHVLRGHTNLVSAVAFSPDAALVLTASTDNSTRLWSLESGELIHTFEGHTGPVWSVDFSPDGRQLVTGSWDGTAALWPVELDDRGNYDTGAVPHSLIGHTSVINVAGFSPDGTRIITVSDDNTAKLWDAWTGKVLFTLTGHTGPLSMASFSPDGQRIVTASFDSTARMWDAETGELCYTLDGQTAQFRTAMFDPTGSRIVTAKSDGTLMIWDGATGQALHTLRGHAGQVRTAMFSPDGSRIVSASQDHTARIWDARTGRQLHGLGGHTNVIWSAVFSPDGTQIVTASQDHTARIWDSDTGQLRHTLAGHTNAIGHAGFSNQATFSPDGTLVVTASQDNTAKVWDVVSGQLRYTLVGHKDAVWSATFSPDGASLATTSGDKTLKVWDTVSGKANYTLEGHTGQVWTAAFSPDGSQLVSASSDNSARIWLTNLADLLAEAERLIPRESLTFTPEEVHQFRLTA